MPQIHLASDIHTEFQADGGESFIQDFRDAAAPVIIVAGDIGNKRTLIPFLTKLCAHRPDKDNVTLVAPDVIYVLGNHEYYGWRPKEIYAALEELGQRCPNFHWLQNSTCTIAGQRYLGTTLWFPRTPATSQLQSELSDFKVIPEFDCWFAPENHLARLFLQDNVSADDVVITHHLPTRSSVAPEYLKDPINCFFVSPLDDLIEERQPKLWVHGHTHSSLDYRYGKTRIVCNPYGYDGRETNASYNPTKLLDV